MIMALVLTRFFNYYFILFVIQILVFVSDCMPLIVANEKKSTNSSRHGTDVTITCNEGYTLSGSPGRQTCTQGEWKGIMPTCIAGKLTTLFPKQRV